MNSTVNLELETGLRKKHAVEFSVFCVENLAERTKKDSVRVFDALARESRILQEYIIPNFDVLHTQGKEYIVDDLLEQMKKEGVKV